MMVTNTYLETGRTFIQLLDVNKDYNAAGGMLADNFEFSTPRFKVKGKDEWLARFPEVHDKVPIFEELEQGDHELQLVRKCTKKMGFVNFSLKQIFEFNLDGEIESIVASKA